MSVLLRLNEVDFHYGEQLEALSGVTFEIRAGDRLAILGANGCGKSTLLRLLDGLVFPTAGSYEAFGETVSETAFLDPAKSRRFRQRVGFVFQNADAMLFNSTVRDELAFGPRQIGLSAEEINSRVADMAAYCSVEHLIDRAPFQLSGGEKRRVALAAMLCLNPDVILMDEPTTGLDPRSQVWLVALLEKLQQAGKTLIVTTHDLGLVHHIAERVIVMCEQHHIVAIGETRSILQNTALLEQVNLIHRDLGK